jgi:hypothetical protein
VLSIPKISVSNSVEGLLHTTIPEAQDENNEGDARAELAEWKKLTERKIIPLVCSIF